MATCSYFRAQTGFATFCSSLLRMVRIWDGVHYCCGLFTNICDLKLQMPYQNSNKSTKTVQYQDNVKCLKKSSLYKVLIWGTTKGQEALIWGTTKGHVRSSFQELLMVVRPSYWGLLKVMWGPHMGTKGCEALIWGTNNGHVRPSYGGLLMSGEAQKWKTTKGHMRPSYGD